MPATSARRNAPDQQATRGHLERALSESAADYDPADTVHQHDESTLNRNRSLGAQARRTTSHTRSSTDPGPGALRARLSRLTEVREDRDDDDDNDEPSQEEANHSSSAPVDDMQARRGMKAKVSYTEELSEPQGSEQLGESSGLHESSFEQDSEYEGPPSYRSARSPSGKSGRRSYLPK